MRNVINVLITAVMLIVITGCSDSAKQPVVGVVTTETHIVGKTAPDFNFTSAEGKVTSFKEVNQPISIIAFTSSSGDVCCQLNRQLVELAKHFRGQPVSVSQVSLPTKNCPHGPGCTEQCNIKDINLIALCDEDLIAWQVYDQPKPDTVILIDYKSQIVAVESLDSLDAVAKKAAEMAQEYTKSYESMYEGG
jgi:hypothetical protein